MAGDKRDGLRATAHSTGRQDMANSDDKDAKGTGIARRAFFGAAIGLGSAAALGAGGARPALAQAGDERTKARYRVTPHVEAFYRTNRYYKGA